MSRQRQTPTCDLLDSVQPGDLADPVLESALARCLGELGNAFIGSMMDAAVDAQAPDVTLFLGLNTTVHDRTEMSEAASVLKEAEKRGYGERSLLPISDPFKGGEDTQKYTMGEGNAERLKTWYEDKDLREGEIRFGDGRALMLGTENLDPSDVEQILAVRSNWNTTLRELGVEEAQRAQICDALLGSIDDPRKLSSGDGATNELLEYVMAMHRSEQGEFDVKSVVLSGHHWSADRQTNPISHAAPGNAENFAGGIWGEDRRRVRDYYHGYDFQNDDRTGLGGDFFAFEDMRNLGAAFPNAYDKVESVHFSACNTHALGMKDEHGQEQSTNAFVQDMFPSVQRTSYWEGSGPGAGGKIGPQAVGESLLDGMAAAAGDEEAWNHAIFNENRKADNPLVRSQMDPSGPFLDELNAYVWHEDQQYWETKLLENDGDAYVRPHTSKKNRRRNEKGFRGYDAPFYERKDLQDHIYQAEDLPRVPGPLDVDVGKLPPGTPVP